MQITVRRSGGFAGLTEELGTVDTERLDEETARKLEQMVQDVTRSAAAGAATVGADLMRYEVTVTDGDRQQVVELGDDGGLQTEALRQLADAVARLRST